MDKMETLAQHWLGQAKKFRGTDKTSIRQKEFGIWQSFTWDQEYEQVRNLTLGLMELGLEKSDRVAIMGDNAREYLWAAYAVMAAGGTVVGLFTDAAPKEVEYGLTHSDATFVLAGDQEQVDKLLEIKQSLPLVKRVIYWDNRGMWGYEEPWLEDYKAVQELGKAVADADKRFEERIQEGEALDAAFFCYTSGTTGLPKGASLSHRNFTYVVTAFGDIDPRYDTDNVVSFIPMAWIGGAGLDIAPHAIQGVILNFAESPETVRENIREIAPDIVFYNARLWETLVDTVHARMLDATWVNRKLYDWFLPVGYRVADFHFNKRPVPAHWRLLYGLGEYFLFKPLRSQFGLHNARAAITAGAALSPDVIRFFHALGLKVRQAYGSTEVTGASVLQSTDDVKFETVGKALPGSRMKVSEEGEVLLGGPCLFLGYHKNPEATEEAIWEDEDGFKWFRTGDAGRLDDDGHLIYFDRVKDMIELKSGDKYSPQYIEGRLKFSPFVGQAMTVGDSSQDFVTALITIDFENVSRWAEKRGLPFTTYTDLAQKSEVYDLISRDVQQVNKTLPDSGQVRKYVLMHKEFDADEGEMTRTRKLRRRFLADRYSSIIDSLYGEKDAVEVKSVVQYQDGRETVINTTLRIESLTEGAPV